ncbi:hypothetical protein [Clostridium sp. UBA2485]|uniref:hypothetical protein n=1 Tax=Clostridium sp. UBA2485 TaxID=1946352 RepID=UPI0025C0C549|nr:hypothetical protein [Clostridium sp. UBA2485]
MLKGLLADLNLDNTEFNVVMQMTTKDIKLNRINFGKRTSLQDVLRIAERRRGCIDGTTIYDSVTGETIGDITELTTEELKCILGIKKALCRGQK